MHSGRGIFLSLWSALSGFILSYLADAKVMKETDMTKKKRQKTLILSSYSKIMIF